jgi:type I pantothenate kinase
MGWAPPAFEVRERPGASLPDLVAAYLDGHPALPPRRRSEGPGTAGTVALPGTGPLVIGIGGSVAAGKSTCAEELRARLPGTVEVISTDGFLHPNAVLEARGLGARKGFPESYDHALADDALGRIAAGHTDVEVPTYSHRTYDIGGPPTVVRRPDVLIIEGVVALQPPIGRHCSVRIYIDAEEGDLRRWYVERFVALAAGGDGFYAQWARLPADEVRQLATMVWEHVNLPNLVAHILPTRWTADIVVRKGPDHQVNAVALRTA